MSGLNEGQIGKKQVKNSRKSKHGQTNQLSISNARMYYFKISRVLALTSCE